MAYAYYPKVILPIRRNLQDTTYDCGPASLKIILETLGVHLDEKKLIKMGKTTPKEGTRPEALIKTLKELGLRHKLIEHANLEILVKAIRHLNLCLVDYQAWGDSGEEFKGLETGHYSVVFGFNKTHLWIADPAKHHPKKQKKWGVRKVRKDLFGQRWADKEVDGTKTHRWMVAIPIVQTLPMSLSSL
ncbi:MAG: cysteine peptidase family C39 domain-containing protein [Candidatus Marinimicrobia bacterium]|nr:cysteine peptidase family C39 domain-containing protein [Candidatus Neomarinimicrobiota bacterium]